MKSIRPILFTLLLTLGFFQAMAYNVSVKGFVFDQNGNGVGQHIVMLKATGTAPNAGYSNQVTTNPDGSFSDEFNFPDGVSGTLTISTKSCRGIIEDKHQFSEKSSEIRSRLEICSLSSRCDVEIELVQTMSSLGLIANAKGVPPFTYEWSTGDTTRRIQIDSLGKYCVKIIDSTGCEAETCRDLVGKDSCNVEILLGRDTTGIFLLAEAKGESPFTYEWNTGDSTKMIYIDIDSIGKYCVEVTDSVGCTSEDCFGQGTMDTCVVKIIPRAVGNQKALTALALGQGPFMYEWSTGDTTQSISVDSMGKYCVTITDTTGCMASDCFTYGQIDSCGVKIDVRTTPSGAFLVATAKGKAPFKYVWDTGDTTQTIMVTQGGRYCVKITDATGCMARACQDITIKDTCGVKIYLKRDSMGVFLLAEATGDSPFKYEWTTGDSTDRIYVDEDSVARYCIIVIDASGCRSKDCYELGKKDTCGVRIIPRPGGPRQGSALTAVGQGAGPFTYEWDTGDTTQTIFVDSMGTYCVTITDTTGCMATDCFKYKQIDSCEVEIETRTSRLGVFLLANSKGTGPFTYEWDTGDTTQVILVDQSGEYCVKVTDATGCMAKACRKIVLRDTCKVVIQVKRDSAGVYLNAEANGTAPFSYKWNTGDTTQTIFVDSTGEYCVEVVDSAGCKAEACFKYGVVDTCGVMIIQLGGPQGNILAAIAMGNAPFTYEWNTGDTTRTILLDSTGEYCVKVVDSTGCTATACFKYSQNDRCEVEIDVRRTGNGILLVARGKGTRPFSYEWSTGDTTQIIQVSAAGEYCVTITDATGCTATACYQFNVNSACDVEIRVFKSGRGVYLWARPKGKGPFTYEWTTGDTTSRILVSPNDEYCVKVTDANGCVASACFNFDNFGCEAKIQVRPSPGNQMTYVLTVKAKGSGAYSYEWSTGDTTQTITVDSMGTYCVTVTDSSGCVSKACVNVPNDRRHNPAGFGGNNDRFNGGVINLFPNPAGQEINLDLKEVEVDQMEYMISTAYGRVLRTGQVEDTDLMSIPIDDLTPGHYTITFKGNQFVQTISFYKN